MTMTKLISGSIRYLSLWELLADCRHEAHFRRILADHKGLFEKAQGSSHNHQAWPGGYLDHVVETMNIAWWLASSSPRDYPFSVFEALEVMFLHDIEKPWLQSPEAPSPAGSFKEYAASSYGGLYTKEVRRHFRATLISHYGIKLTPEQENALKYVEGVPDSEYTPGERTMGELATFCHCCDILSARLWHDKGRGRSWNE
jgi:hypothetical protein